MMKIEKLIDKYFEGETTCQEEQRLRRFFNQDNVPQHLECYRPQFAYIDQEARLVQTRDRQRPAHHMLKSALFWTANAAACTLLTFAIGHMVRTGYHIPENYVVINGTCYTDPELVKEKAREAMQNVSFNAEELDGLLFPNLGTDLLKETE